MFFLFNFVFINKNLYGFVEEYVANINALENISKFFFIFF